MTPYFETNHVAGTLLLIITIGYVRASVRQGAVQ